MTCTKIVPIQNVKPIAKYYTIDNLVSCTEQCLREFKRLNLISEVHKHEAGTTTTHSEPFFVAFKNVYTFQHLILCTSLTKYKII